MRSAIVSSTGDYLFNFLAAQSEQDSKVAILASRILHEYRVSQSLLKASSKALRMSNLPRAEKDSARLVILEPKLINRIEFGNKRLRELAVIIATGLELGSNIEKSLEMFVKRVEQEIMLENKLRSKIGSMQTLTYLGVSLFFPLFSGITAVILNTSFGILGSGVGPGNGILPISAVYIVIILYLSSAFAHPEKNLKGNVAGIVPYVAVSLAVLYATQHYISYVL